MVKPRYENVDLQCWECEKASIGERKPTLCLKGSSQAGEILLELLDELKGLQPPAHRTLTLLPSRRPKSCTKIRCSIAYCSDALVEMSLTRTEAIANFEFTAYGLESFREAVSAWTRGTEDFSVHPDIRNDGRKDLLSGEVWFWTPFTDP